MGCIYGRWNKLARHILQPPIPPGTHVRPQGRNSDDLATVLATLVRLTTHDAGRSALVAADVPAMAAQWLTTSSAVRLFAASADQHWETSEQSCTEVTAGRQQGSAPVSAGDEVIDHHEVMSVCQQDSGGAATGDDAFPKSRTLQLLRLIRNLCAAGAAAADPLTAGGVPAQLARLVMELDPHAPGNNVLIRGWIA